jgi:hypothetical protein
MRVLICGGRDPSPEVCDEVWNWVMENCSEGDVVIPADAQAALEARDQRIRKKALRDATTAELIAELCSRDNTPKTENEQTDE